MMTKYCYKNMTMKFLPLRQMREMPGRKPHLQRQTRGAGQSILPMTNELMLLGAVPFK